MPEIFLFGHIRCAVSCTESLTKMPELKVSNDKITGISMATPTTTPALLVPVPPFESAAMMNGFSSPSLVSRGNYSFIQVFFYFFFHHFPVSLNRIKPVLFFAYLSIFGSGPSLLFLTPSSDSKNNFVVKSQQQVLFLLEMATCP